MSAYNILFPFLIILTLGIVIFILIKHFPEAVSYEISPIKKEKRRWWQMFLGWGESLLRHLRLRILKLDNKLTNSIKKVREQKEKINEGLRGYRIHSQSKEKPFQQDPMRNYASNELEKETTNQAKEEDATLIEEEPELVEDIKSPDEQRNEDMLTDQKFPEEKIESSSYKLKKGISSALKIFNRPETVKVRPEPIKTKTFSANEIKVERQFYLKKKEELLIQTIVNDPKNVSLYLQLGRIYYNQKNYIDAKNAFEEALRLDKTNVKAREELKRIEKYL